VFVHYLRNIFDHNSRTKRKQNEEQIAKGILDIQSMHHGTVTPSATR